MSISQANGRVGVQTLFSKGFYVLNNLLYLKHAQGNDTVQNITWNLKLYSFGHLNVGLEHLQISACESPQVPTGYTVCHKRISVLFYAICFMEFVI